MSFFSWVCNPKTASTPRRAHARQRATTRRALNLECLEDRCLLSAGAMDLPFGSDGIVTMNVGLADATAEAAHAVALQSDGKIIAVGVASTGTSRGGFSEYDFAAVRFNTDGTLDTSFSGDGKTTTDLATDNTDAATDVEVQSDGKIVVSGYASADFAVVRYNTDGSLDTTFGGKSKGIVTTSIGKNSGDLAFAMELQADGKIVLAGVTRANNSTLYDLALVRYNLDGSLDNSFSGDGKATTHFSSSVSAGPTSMEMAIYASNSPNAGKIVVAADLTGDRGTIVARYNPNGSLDTSFGGGAGYVTLASLGAPYDVGAAVAIQADDRIVVSLIGRASGGTDSSDVYLARLQSDGSLDPAFGSNGIFQAMFPEQQEATSIAIQPDGKIVVAGYYKGQQSFAVRCNANGSLDTAFGANGIAIVSGVTTMFNNQKVDVAIQSDGKLILAGGTPMGDFALARLQGDDPAPALRAAFLGNRAVTQQLVQDQVEPLLAEALARWQAAGMDTSALSGVDVRIADLGGVTIGMVSGNTIYLDDNAAGWGWFVDSTPNDDSEFVTPGNQGEQGRIDLLTVLIHEVGHLLGQEHETDGVMAATLADGTRLSPAGDAFSPDSLLSLYSIDVSSTVSWVAAHGNKYSH